MAASGGSWHKGRFIPAQQQRIANMDAAKASRLSSFDFARFLLPQLPTGTLALHHYLGATSRDIFKRRSIPTKMTYHNLLKIIWQDPKTKYSLVKSPAFAYACAGRPPHHTLLTDQQHNPLICYKPSGFNTFFNDVTFVHQVD